MAEEVSGNQPVIRVKKTASFRLPEDAELPAQQELESKPGKPPTQAEVVARAGHNNLLAEPAGRAQEVAPAASTAEEEDAPAFSWSRTPGAAGSDEQQAAAREFVAFAAFRWGLLHELFMDEHKNGAALGGELLKVNRLALRCLASKDWVRLVANLGFAGDALAVFRHIVETFPSEESERQLRAAGVDSRSVMTLAQLRRFEEEMSVKRLSLSVQDEGSPSWQFANFLKRSRQNLLRAWRLDLDVKQTGTVSFPDFANACRRLGLQGQCRMIWTSLRPLDDKALEFADLAPNEAAHVEAFAEMIWETSGYDLDKAWRLFDYDQKNKLTKGDFVQSARHLGFQGNADLLFKGLDATGLGWVWRDDFDYIPKVSQVARQRLHGAEGPLAGLVRFAQREMGGAEELISKLGLGGAQSEVTVCDLAARLTALGYDGDAQRVAVHAAKCDSGSGTNVSSEKLYRILTAQKKEKPCVSDRPEAPAAISPNVYMRKRSTGAGVSAKLLTKKKPVTPVSQHPPWNSSMQDLIGDSNKLHPNLRKYFSDFDPEHIRKKQAASQAMKEAAKTSSKFSPPARASTTSRSSARQAKPNWITSLPAESENTPRACRRYFQSGEHKPVRDEVHDLLRMRANHTPGLQDGGAGSSVQFASTAVRRAQSVPG